MKLQVIYVVFLEVAIFVPSAQAIVDQQYVPARGNGSVAFAGGIPFAWAQTFTVGISGTLVGVDLWIDRHESITEPLLFDIRKTQDGIPTVPHVGGNILASAVIPAAAIPISQGTTGATPAVLPHIDLTTSPIPVVAGEVLAIALLSDDPGSGNVRYLAHINAPGGYLGGSIFAGGPSSWGNSQDEFDMIFRTYVIPVPEPSSCLILLIGGVLLTGGRMFRR